MKTLTLILTIALLCSSSLFAEMVIIVSKESNLSSVKNSDVKKLFTGRSKKIAGERLNPVFLKTGAAHDTFLSKVIKRKQSQLDKAWKKLVFTGKAKMPKKLEGDNDVISAIAEDSKLIGYVSKGSVTDDVKVVTVK